MEVKTITVTLSKEQLQILKHLEQGLTQKEISETLNIDTSKLKRVIYLMTHQMQCLNVTQLIAYAIRNNII